MLATQRSPEIHGSLPYDTATSIPIDLTHDQEPNPYQGTMLCSFIFDGIVPKGEMQLSSGETRSIRITQLTAINPSTEDKIDLSKAIKDGRLATIYVENGVFKILSLHHVWHNQIEKEDAWTVEIRSRINGNYSLPKNLPKDGMGIAKLPDSSYNNMVHQCYNMLKSVEVASDTLAHPPKKTESDCLIL